MARKSAKRARKNSEFRHLHNSGFYRSWCAMNTRCNNKNTEDYPRYGGRGIKVVETWKDFSVFYTDMYDLWVKHKKENTFTSLDRIDVNKDYSKRNCRWADMKVQCNNRRNHKMLKYRGETHNLNQWAEKLGIKRSTLAQRIYVYKWPTDRALST